MTGLHRALFLDRDGVINIDKGYVYLPEAIEWIPGVAEAIHYANSLNYRVIVISNQSGVARGYFTENDVKNLHEWMSRELQRSGAVIDAFYYCPHHPDFGGPCDCRKPEPGLYLRAARDFNLRLSECLAVGDKPRDVDSARRAGVPAHLFRGGDLHQFLVPLLRP
mgnify:FL=1|jgi:histidinol-phosphate phosphatase family domain/HAD-superfamily hydrolase, subfamily IIIA